MFLGLVIIYSRCKYFTLICVIKNLLAFYQVTIKTFKGGDLCDGIQPKFQTCKCVEERSQLFVVLLNLATDESADEAGRSTSCCDCHVSVGLAHNYTGPDSRGEGGGGGRRG